MKKFIVNLFLILFVSNIIAQKDTAKTQFFPDGLHLLPIKAYYKEPKVGMLFYPNSSNIKIDLGLPMDIFLIRFNQNEKMTIGFEAMIYLLSTNYKEQRFQIDSFDGLFGGNIILSFNNVGNKIYTKFRIIHNSAHLVDGHWDRATGNWIDNKDPIPWAQDFGELTFVQEFYTDFGLIKYYGASAYCNLVRPKENKRWFFNIGGEINFNSLLGEIFSQSTNLFIAYNFSLNGLPKYMGSNNVMMGIKFGDYFGKGIILYLSYFCGNDMISEYYFERVSKFGLGFMIEYF